MAYRYLDGQGTEVPVVDRRALAHRIQRGEVAASTLMLDEDRAEWVCAARHPAYLELVEGASGDGIRPTEIAVGAPSTNSFFHEPLDAEMRLASRGGAARSEVDSSASPESVRATWTSSADPASVASRSTPWRPDPPFIRRVARRGWSWRRAARRVTTSAAASLATILIVVLFAGVLSKPDPIDGATANLGPGDPPFGALAGFTASGERYPSRIAELRGEFGLPSSPPAIWLEGAYLAYPDRYPDVLEYWDAFGALVQAVKREDLVLFRSGLEAYLRGSDLSDPERARAWLWVVRAYVLRRERRGNVFDDFLALAAAASDLHLLLLRYGGQIEYDPVGRTGVSRNPVLEVVTNDEVVAGALADGLDRVLDSLGELHGFEPVSTDRLTRELLDRLWAATATAIPPSVVAVR
ncbi:MAG: hypothetical protein BMS9Abin29_2424 [Gemmatimonadota bacterium]|nr:MAG: hypothetical protein BMS9Abin29_2424 [Gemmatimonadota bacterium]